MLFDMERDELFSKNEGFTKGNMFTYLYTPYKDYIPAKLDFNKEVDNMSYEFVINELKLYLCTHPNDEKVREKLKKYESEYKKDKKEEKEINAFTFWRDYYV